MMRLAPLLTISLVAAIAGPVLSAFADSPVATHLSIRLAGSHGPEVGVRLYHP
jgi:hypothetical protein